MCALDVFFRVINGCCDACSVYAFVMLRVVDRIVLATVAASDLTLSTTPLQVLTA
jgi:hypothetical protein